MGPTEEKAQLHDEAGDKGGRSVTPSYKARKRLSLLILLVGMPVYVVAAVNVIDAVPRLPAWAEVPVYIFLGVAWILPFKAVFKGIGQADPDEPPEK